VDRRATTAEALAELEPRGFQPGRSTRRSKALEDAHIRAAGLLRDSQYPGLARPAPLAPTPVDLSETPAIPTPRADPGEQPTTS